MAWYPERANKDPKPHLRLLLHPYSQLHSRPTPFYSPCMLTQTWLDSRAPGVLFVLGECCQFLGVNPCSLNSRLGFWALVTMA